MSEDDFYKPTNIRDTLFAGIGKKIDIVDLPQNSVIEKGSNKYQAEDEDNQDDFDIGFTKLGEVSTLQAKGKGDQIRVTQKLSNSNANKQLNNSNLTRRPTSSQRQSSEQKQQPKPSTNAFRKPAQQVRKVPSTVKGKKDGKKSDQQKKVIDLDKQIGAGQVRQWGYKEENEKQSDFDKSDEEQYEEPKTNKQEQDKLRKIAEEKAKILADRIQNRSSGGQQKPMGLKAKAQQLRQQNLDKGIDNAQKQLSIITQQQNSNIHEQSTDNIRTSHQTAKIQQPSKPLNQDVGPSQEQQSQDDPWQKINQKTKQEYQKKEDKKQAEPMTKQQIVEYYSKKFIFVEDDIEVEFEEVEEEKPGGFWDMLCGCFAAKDDGDGKKGKKTSKDRIAMRLLAISKVALSNTDQEFFILEEIWTKLTQKKFSRYGNHWNQVGFQGRDPGTDLRSTGVLSILQWYLFIIWDITFAKKMYEWTVQNDFPLALTHIKVTGLFLKFLKKGKIRANSWNDYQKYYNALVCATFKKIEKNFNPSDNIGQVVDTNLESVGKNLSSCMKDYEGITKKG